MLTRLIYYKTPTIGNIKMYMTLNTQLNKVFKNTFIFPVSVSPLRFPSLTTIRTLPISFFMSINPFMERAIYGLVLPHMTIFASIGAPIRAKFRACLQGIGSPAKKWFAAIRAYLLNSPRTFMFRVTSHSLIIKDMGMILMGITWTRE